MEILGTLHDLSRDWKTDQVHITFTIDNESVLQEIEKYKNSKLSIKVQKYRKKRSLDANSYMWKLIELLSIKTGIPRKEIYIDCLYKYGSFTFIPLRKKDICLAEDYYRIVRERGSQKVTDENGNVAELHILQCWKGSSKYDSKEMSRLIDGVLDECRIQGIPESEFLTPNQKAELLDKWGVVVG